MFKNYPAGRDPASREKLKIRLDNMDNPKASHEPQVALKDSKIKEISNLNSLRWCLILLVMLVFVVFVGIFIAYYYVGYIAAVGL